MDKLEKQIINYRDELDRYSPDPEVWQKIQKENRRLTYRRTMKVSGWAASIIVIISSSLLLLSSGANAYISFGSSDNRPIELVETEIYYSGKINSLIEEAQPLLTANPGLGNDLMLEIADLDSLYLDIKKDLRDNVSNDEVIEALISNYRIKVQILEEMLELLNEDDTNNEKSLSYEI